MRIETLRSTGMIQCKKTNKQAPQKNFYWNSIWQTEQEVATGGYAPLATGTEVINFFSIYLIEKRCR